MKEKLQRFLSGRYGFDQLFRFLLMTAVVCTLLSVLLRNAPVLGSFFNAASVVLLLWATFRVFSRNIEKRYLENLHYMQHVASVIKRFLVRREMHRQRKEYKFFVCPSCKTNLRVPKGKGKINITCCKCGNRFQGKS
jgi:hypothetical protein